MTRAARPADPARKAAESRGRRSEALVALYLRLKGYRVLARRYRTKAGEIDLIVSRGRTIAFVEVKHRQSEVEGISAVSSKARRRIARAAELWVAAHPASAGLDHRYDIVVALPRRWPRHLTGVFDSRGESWPG